MTKDKQVSVILAKVFNCGASQCMSIYTEKDTLTPEQALIDLNQIYQVKHHEQASPLPVPLEDREELNISPLTNPNKKYKIIENGKIEGYWNEDNTPFIITCPEQLQDILLYVLNNLEKK